jgi:hypothetical protein
MDFQNIVIILLIIVIFYDNICSTYNEFFHSIMIKSNLDGETYKVASDYIDSKEAADKMADINLFTIKLIDKLKSVYINSDAQTPEQKKGLVVTNILLSKFNSNSLSENDPIDFTKTSYTKNKGEEISLCLREKISGENKLHSSQLLKFVMLHELAHIITPELEHTPLFWNNFRFLLDFCAKYDLYRSDNYTINNTMYCGMKIEYNPFYDNRRTVSFFGV